MYIVVITAPSQRRFYSVARDDARGRSIGKSTCTGYHYGRRFRTITAAEKHVIGWKMELSSININKHGDDLKWIASIEFHLPPMMIGRKLAISKKPRRSKESA